MNLGFFGSVNRAHTCPTYKCADEFMDTHVIPAINYDLSNGSKQCTYWIDASKDAWIAILEIAKRTWPECIIDIVIDHHRGVHALHVSKKKGCANNA